MRTTIVEVDRQRVRVVDAGAGDPVVVLHGWGGRIESMQPVITCVAERFRVLALDLPGFGESPVPAGVWETPDYAECVHDVLRELGVGGAHLIGHSFGAKIAFYLAATHPEMVDKLILVGSPGIRARPSVKTRMKKAAARGARLVGLLGPMGRRIRQRVYDRVASSDYAQAGAMRPILVRVVNEDLRHVLPRVRSSTLLVWGSEDDAVPVANAFAMERLMPDAGTVVLDGAGHFCYLDHSQRFCRVVRHFLGAPVS